MAGPPGAIGLRRLHRFIESGGVFKLAFGPKAFIVVSDPVVVRHLLKVKSMCPKAAEYTHALGASVYGGVHVCMARCKNSTLLTRKSADCFAAQISCIVFLALARENCVFCSSVAGACLRASQWQRVCNLAYCSTKCWRRC